jgi:hypothetical protein
MMKSRELFREGKFTSQWASGTYMKVSAPARYVILCSKNSLKTFEGYFVEIFKTLDLFVYNFNEG